MPNTAPEEAAAMPGGRTPSTTVEDVREVFDDREDRAEPLTATEIADRLDCSRKTALNKLNRLEEQRAVASKKPGARARVWWVPLPEAESPASAGAVAAGPGTTPQPRGETPSDASEPSAGSARNAGADTDAHEEPPANAALPGDDAVARAVNTWAAENWDDAPDRLAARKRAAAAVLEQALETGSVGKSAVEEELFPEYPVPGQSFDTWWRKNVRGLLGEVGEYNSGLHAYRVDRGRLEDLAE